MRGYWYWAVDHLWKFVNLVNNVLTLPQQFDDKRKMTKASYDTNSVLDTAMQIIQDEHHVFVEDGIDNDEHIPRIIRIARSAGKLLLINGMAKRDVDANIERIINYGRQLFIEEWMKPFPGDDEPPLEEEAIEEFDKYLKKARRLKKK